MTVNLLVFKLKLLTTYETAIGNYQHHPDVFSDRRNIAPGMLAHGNWHIISCVTLLGNDFRKEIYLILLLIPMKVRPNVEVAYATL